MYFFTPCHDELSIDTIPWAICRTLVYPIVNINKELQKTTQDKKFDDFNPDDQMTKVVPAPLPQKIKYAKKVFENSGIKGFYNEWELYVIPFTTSRLYTKLKSYFAIIRLFVDVLGFLDSYFLVTAIAIFFCDIPGSFVFNLTNDLLTVHESQDLKVYLNRKNRRFWKQYEIDHVNYQVYGYFQSYVQLISYWYFEPNIIIEILLYSISRIVGVVSSSPLGYISKYAGSFNYDFVKTANFFVKKFGPLGLFAGVTDSCIVEIVLSIIQVPMGYLFRHIM